jgi:hypothetical protein
MPCENYKNALIEAAVSGTEPQSELLAHLAICDVCRTVLAEEQFLFTSIDSGLRQSGNAEIPASLLPRVRARISEEVVPHRNWLTNWLAVASAAAIIAAFFVARVVWHSNLNQNPPANTAQVNLPTPTLPPPEAPMQTAEPSAGSSSHPSPHSLVVRNSQNPRPQAARYSIPEVLVPQDQEVLLAAYAEQWRYHKRGSLLSQNSGETILAPLEVAPIQIAELDVKLLADEKSQ